MQLNESLIRSVVAQVLAEVSKNGAPVSVKSFNGRHGIFTCPDEAVAAARDAFEQLQERTIEDRKRIIDHIRRISIDNCVELGGLDALIFTCGIGENGVGIRTGVCAGLEELGISLNPALNAKAKGEFRISPETSPVQIWTIPTNEELIVARQTKHLLET